METTIELEIDEEYQELVDGAGLQAVMAAVLQRHAGKLGEEVSLTLVVTNDEEMQALNRFHRDIDAPTDVLSFAAREEDDLAPQLVLPPELPPELVAEIDRHLGDIVIAYPYAARQAAQFGNSVAAELRLLAVHGTLHLLGFDHAAPEEEEAMWAEQATILAPWGDANLTQRTYTE